MLSLLWLRMHLLAIGPAQEMSVKISFLLVFACNVTDPRLPLCPFLVLMLYSSSSSLSVSLPLPLPLCLPLGPAGMLSFLFCIYLACNRPAFFSQASSLSYPFLSVYPSRLFISALQVFSGFLFVSPSASLPMPLLVPLCLFFFACSSSLAAPLLPCAPLCPAGGLKLPLCLSLFSFACSSSSLSIPLLLSLPVWPAGVLRGRLRDSLHRQGVPRTPGIRPAWLWDGKAGQFHPVPL